MIISINCLFFCRKFKTGRALPTNFIILLLEKQERIASTKKLYAMYGDEALKGRQCRNWFQRFRSGEFSLINT